MDAPDLFFRFSAALGIGLLVGLERGWATRTEAPGSRTAGVRTFALTGLLGGTFGGLARTLPDVSAGLVLAVAFLGFSAAFALFCREENRAEGVFSATNAVAGMLTFALSAYAVAGDTTLAVAGGVAGTAILAMRKALHGWIDQITERELRAGLLLLAMTFIALPLLPDRAIGPFGGVNPRQVWLVAIVLAAVSFFGYAVVRMVGETRGILIAAAAGGLVSSTAVMLNNARLAAAGQGAPRLLAAGAMLSTAISLVRVLAIVGALNQAVLAALWPSLVAATVAATAAALLLALRTQAPAKLGTPALQNPFDLKAVLAFAVLLAALQMGSNALASVFGGSGAIAVAALAGLADVDALTVSMARLAPNGLPVGTAAIAILVAAASNTLSKVAIGVAIGRGWFAVQVALASLVTIAAAVAGWIAAQWLLH